MQRFLSEDSRRQIWNIQIVGVLPWANELTSWHEVLTIDWSRRCLGVLLYDNNYSKTRLSWQRESIKLSYSGKFSVMARRWTHDEDGGFTYYLVSRESLTQSWINIGKSNKGANSIFRDFTWDFTLQSDEVVFNHGDAGSSGVWSACDLCHSIHKWHADKGKTPQLMLVIE